jgi:hypothetical protein
MAARAVSTWGRSGTWADWYGAPGEARALTGRTAETTIQRAIEVWNRRNLSAPEQVNRTIGVLLDGVYSLIDEPAPSYSAPFFETLGETKETLERIGAFGLGGLGLGVGIIFAAWLALNVRR